jgi:glutamyl-tRNA synthetase
MSIITRFAPSPTGFMHIGNARTAIINYLFSKKNNGKFILRIDDTDKERSKIEYEDAIKESLEFFSIKYDETFNQKNRTARYDEIKEELINKGRLYPCFETPEELEFKRKVLLSASKPPIYDRSSLKLTKEQIEENIKKGKVPHYRFLLNHAPIKWIDMVKGDIEFHGANLSDPILIREDGTMTYMLSSVIDDIDYKITDIIRGEDHITNTAIQTQMFEAVDKSFNMPNFGHVSLVKTQDEKMSKRVGGYDIKSYREKGMEPEAIMIYLATLGSSLNASDFDSVEELVSKYDISLYSKNAVNFSDDELNLVNAKILHSSSYKKMKHRLNEFDIEVTEEFYHSVIKNVSNIREIKDWIEICNNFDYEKQNIEIKNNLIQIAIDCLPENLSLECFKTWTKEIASKTSLKGKDLFMPLRVALTKRESGPELAVLFNLLSKNEIQKRLSVYL